MAFQAGKQVACIDVSGAALLALGRVYTITSINWPFLRINCEPDGFTGTASDCGYHHSRFRPVVERKTDISIFTSMLNPSPVVVDSFRIADHAREIVG